MGFRKVLYDVEERGLDPRKPHKNIGVDGRLIAKVVPDQPTAANSSSSDIASQEEKSTQQPSMGVAVKVRKEKEVETPTNEKVSTNIDLQDELPQATKELSDDELAHEPKKRTTKPKTKAKTNTSSTKKPKKAKEGV